MFPQHVSFQVAEMVEKHRDSQQLWDYLTEQYQFDREKLDDVFHYGKFMWGRNVASNINIRCHEIYV